jgi:predicted TIM-barrel enzyme
MPRLERQAVLTKFQVMKKARRPVIGGGAGTGLSAKYEEAEGIDLIVSRRFKAIVFEKRATKEML